ncbi:MAG: Rrf2 family transcriptional regulator [Candidatus Glassbacteria bacterium]|nr:Rrf2 family transcriptional regulator [Candidatus Glassbacteria bacterium]
MIISKKCQYALRAVFELAKYYGQHPLKIAHVAQKQAIPARFLEVILCELKKTGFVQSQRGNEGGYLLSVSPAKLTVGEVIRFFLGPVGPVDCLIEDSQEGCPLYGDCAFIPMWEKVQTAVNEIYDNTTFQELVDQEKWRTTTYDHSYVI